VNVKRYDYVAQFGDDIDRIVAAMRELMLAGRYGIADEVAAFERDFSGYLGVRYASGTNTGTDALVVALAALGVGRGDEVITQANTFNATVAAICLVGATPVLVDAQERTFLIDEVQLEGAVTSRTRAVIPVHLCGKPTPMDGILRLSESRGIYVVEDAAQAHGARIAGRAVGTFGTVGCFSFHPSKNLAAAGDGGAVVTDDAGLDSELKSRRALGQRRQNDHVAISPHSQLHALQAIVLREKLSKLDEWNRQRREVAARYREVFAGLPLKFQETTPDEEHVFHLFQVRTTCRDRLLHYLQAADIDAVVRYPVPIHLQPAFAEQGWRLRQFPVAERLADELLCLPIRPDLTEGEIEYVAKTVRTFFGS
jgi:dTDP-4-amino-4,6-dideoxygalactose transaminase